MEKFKEVVNEEKNVVIKVSGGTPTKNLSGSIMKALNEGKGVELRAIGAGAVNQMYKSLATARGMIGTQGKDLTIRPGFSSVIDDGVEKTVMIAVIVID